MKIDSIEKLKEVFYNEIIPLLEEYFYGDNERLRLVLGKEFFKSEEKVEDINKLFEEENAVDEPKIQLLPSDEINFHQAIQNIITLKQNKNQDD